jgi:hypothetical protein
MNNTFDWNRFKKLVAMDFRGMWPRFGMSMLIITLIPAAMWIFCALLSLIPEVDITIPAVVRWGFLAATVFICVVLVPSRMFKTCNLPKDGIYYAMLPASHLEKYLSQLLYCVIVCPLMCFLSGVVVDLFLTVLPFGAYHEWLWEPLGQLDEINLDLASAANGDTLEAVQFVKFIFSALVFTVIVSYLFYSASFMFTNTIFKSHKVLKTFLAFIVINFVLSLITNPIMFGTMFANMENIGDTIPEGFFQPYKTLMIVSDAIYAVINAVLFVWTYFRLKRMKY